MLETIYSKTMFTYKTLNENGMGQYVEMYYKSDGYYSKNVMDKTNEFLSKESIRS